MSVNLIEMICVGINLVDVLLFRSRMSKYMSKYIPSNRTFSNKNINVDKNSSTSDLNSSQLQSLRK